MNHSRFTPLSCMSREEEEGVAKLLQLQCCWKDVAGSLNISHLDINWLQSSPNGCSSLKFLQHLKDKNEVSLEVFMSHLKKLEFLAVYKLLEEAYPRLRKTYEETHTMSPSTSSRNKDPKHTSTSSCPATFHHTSTMGRNVPLFITFCPSDTQHSMQMLMCLETNGFCISVDHRNKGMSRQEYMNHATKRFQNAHYVLFLITPTYLETVAENGEEIGLQYFHKIFLEQIDSSTNHQSEINKQKNSTSFHKTYLGVVLTDTFPDSPCQHASTVIDCGLKNTIRSQTPLKNLFCWPQEHENLVRFLSIPQDSLHFYITASDMRKITKRWSVGAVESKGAVEGTSKHHENNGYPSKSIILNVKNIARRCKKKGRVV